VIIGYCIGLGFNSSPVGNLETETGINRFIRSDARRYLAICADGYDHPDCDSSTIVFFPLFPCCAKAITFLCGCESRLALLLVSNVSFFLCIVLLREYVASMTKAPPGFVVIVMCLAPNGVFFRLPYSESLFLLLVIGAFYTLKQSRSVVAAAILTGIASASRSTAVAMIPVLALHIWESAPSLAERAVKLAFVIPLSCVGAIVFAGWQWREFGSPLFFVTEQRDWAIVPSPGFTDQSLSLLSLEPVWGTYLPGSAFYWSTLDRGTLPFWASLNASNALFVLASVVLLIWGYRSRIIDRYELLFSLSMLAFAYVMSGSTCGMRSQGRYCSVVFPLYIVLSVILYQSHIVLRIVVCVLASVLLIMYSALYTAGYPVY
jgi:hypothetical protein